MIIDKKDITNFSGAKFDNELAIKREVNLHNPSGVFFEKVRDNETYDFLYFAVAAINELGEIEDRKVFDGTDSTSFFKAADYFEELIEKRTPEKKNEPPSVGIFVFIKRLKNLPSFVDIGIQELVTIDEEDLEKVFTPPMKKPFGRLDMTIVDKPKYDVIKSKFALTFSEELTDEYSDKLDVEKSDIYVYKITPYQNQPNDPGNQQQQEPEEVNDEELSLDKIEGEEPEKMKGEEPKKDKDKEKDKQQKDKDKSESDEDDQDSSDEDDQDSSEEDGDDSDDSDGGSDDDSNDNQGDDSDEDADEDSDKDGNDDGDNSDDDSDDTGEPNESEDDSDDSDESDNESDEESDNESDEESDGDKHRKKNKKDDSDEEDLEDDIEDDDSDEDDLDDKNKKVTPKVGDLVQFRDSYGIVVSFNSETRQTQIKKLTQDEWMKKAQEKEQNRKQGKTSSSGGYNIVGAPASPEMKKIADEIFKIKNK